MQRACDPEVSFAELSRCIQHEPALATEVLRLANSSAYSSGKEVSSVHQAVLVLGSRTIRNMAVSCAVRAAIGDVVAPGFDINRFWENSLRRAILAQILAQRVGGVDDVDAFTVGLIQDVGTLLLAVRHPHRAAALDAATRLPGNERLVREVALTGENHPHALSEAAKDWQLPEDLVTAVRFHHNPTAARPGTRLRRLVEVCHVADALADIVQVDPKHGPLLIATDVVERLQLSAPLKMDEVIGELGPRMEELANDFGFRLTKQPNFTEVVVRSNRLLLEMTSQYEDLVREKELLVNRQQKLLRETEALRTELEKANSRLAHLVATDVLTGLASRRAFVSTGQQILGESTEPLVFLLLDLDHFKHVNDTFGHRGGDAVLQEVARRIRGVLPAGTPAGRIGGEEIAVLMENCNRIEGLRWSEKVRNAIAENPIWFDGHAIQVTASVGAASWEAEGSRDYDHLFGSADQALYASKNAGRNCTHWFDGDFKT
jgi:diguanylate cyclase (GGDEF)-like protein